MQLCFIKIDLFQFSQPNGSAVTFTAFYGKSHESWTLKSATNLTSALIRICVDSDVSDDVTQKRSVHLIANSGDQSVTVSINVTLMDSIDLTVDAEAIEASVTLLSPLTLIAQRSDAAASLILKLDNQGNLDNETGNVCMMVTVQVS